MLQCAVVCCSVLQCAAVATERTFENVHLKILRIATCRNVSFENVHLKATIFQCVLQCVAMFCSVLQCFVQCVAVCCSELQSELQSVAVCIWRKIT